MHIDHIRKITNSALWAAYGDAMGFITELADPDMVKRRANRSYIDDTIPWSRLLGGRFGAIVDLPIGCYSDDTQLRLSTSRSIRSDGSFDIDSFAKVELPTFDAYALGAGRSTKAAAQSLATTSANWFSNFYDKGRVRYIEAGGNGAAMRIQPHIWSQGSLEIGESCLTEIIRNCISTHGHPRALAGALIHAIHLSIAIWKESIPSPATWALTVDQLEKIPNVLATDGELLTIWLPSWEARAKNKWNASWHDILHELRGMLSTARRYAESDGPAETKYLQLITALDATNEEIRGDAVRTAVLSLFLAWHFRDQSPHGAIELAVNSLKTDTDSIATLTGALLGSISPQPPEGAVMDRAYICSEAKRMAEIAVGKRPASFEYPNLLTWRPPKSQLDVVTLQKGEMVIAGLGAARSSGRIFRAKSSDVVWEILELSQGQTLIIKRRAKLLELDNTHDELFSKDNEPRSQPSFIEHTKDAQASDVAHLDIEGLTASLITAGFPPAEIGRALLKFAELDVFSAERAIAFTAIIVKARRARLIKNKTK